MYNKDRGVAQVRVTMITPPATPEMIVKLKKQLQFHRPIRYSNVDFEFVLKHLFSISRRKVSSCKHLFSFLAKSVCFDAVITISRKV